MRKVFIILALMLLCGACDRPAPVDASLKIGFTSQLSNRSLINADEDLQQQEIRLYGAYTLDDRSARVFDAERLYYDSTIPGWDYVTPRYWIMNAAYRFCALSPYSVPCTFFDEDGQTIIGKYEGYTGGPDVLYASAERDLADKEDYSTVQLRFRHACAAVQFNLVNGSSQTLTNIRNIRLVGLQNRGQFSFKPNGESKWVLDGSTVDANGATQPFGGICTLPNGGLTVNLNVKHPLYDETTLIVLPQTVYKTDVVLHLEYIKEGDAEYAVRDIKLGWLDSASAPTVWKAGEKYEYNLTITDNYITPDVIVVDWVDNFVDL